MSITEPADNGVGSYVQTGACSWYGPGFHGRRTSNGEIFDKYELTAAHPTLPFGSQVEVKDIGSGKKVRVRINDRGPYAKHRILDLSYAAAASLGIVNKGTANVEVRLVDVDDTAWPDSTWALQVGRFSSQDEANRFIASMTERQKTAGLYYIKGPDAEAKDYRVRFGPYNCENSAKSAVTRLQRVGFKPELQKEGASRSEPATSTTQATSRKTTAPAS